MDEEIDDSEIAANPDRIIDEASVLLTYLFASPALFAKAAPILKAEYFHGNHADAVQFVLDQYNKTHTVPNRLIISGKTGFLPEVVTDQNEPTTVDLIAESIESYCRKQAGDKFLLDAVDRLGKDRSNATMAALRSEMERITQISMARDLGSEFHEDYRKFLEKAKANSNISTGSEYIDLVLGGGTTRPCLSIFSAATGDGKSLFLANRAVDFIRRHPDQDVVYYTLENSEAVTYQRLAAIMAEIDIRTVFDRIDDVAAYVVRSKGREGKLFIKRFPFRGTTISDVRAHFYDLRAQRDAKLGAFFLDYMDLLSPSVEGVRIDNIHVRDEQVTNEMYDFIHREELIGWTAAQQTKGADEEVVASKGKVSGGVKKVHACDNLFIAKRNDEDALMERIWVHCKKARTSGGINAAIPINWDNRTQKMSDWKDRLDFERLNPRLFGLSARDRIGLDPVAREAGVSAPERSVPTAESTADAIRSRMLNRIRSPLRMD